MSTIDDQRDGGLVSREVCGRAGDGVGWDMPALSPSATAARRAQADALLDGGATFSQAAEALGVDRRTIARWRSGRPVPPPSDIVKASAELASVRAETLTGAARVQRAIAADLHRNLEVLQEIRDNPDADTSARVRAAMTLLDRGGVPVGSEVRVEVAHSPTPAELAVELLAMPGPVADNREAVSK